MSAAMMTPPANFTPRTDVPVTIGLLRRGRCTISNNKKTASKYRESIICMDTKLKNECKKKLPVYKHKKEIQIYQ